MVSGAALSHEHDCIDIRSDSARVGNGTRWVAICRCGQHSVALTIESAARMHRGHADVALGAFVFRPQP